MKRGCTQCGECLNVCPVFMQFMREEYSPKAKRLLLEPIEADTATLPWEQIVALSRLCAGCGKCQQACARKLSTAELLADMRAKHPHWSQKLWEIWIRRLGPLWPTVGRIASLMPKALTPAMLQSSLDTAKAIVNKTPLEPWVEVRRDPSVTPDYAPVVVFAGCTAQNVRPQWRSKAEKLLGAFGYTVLDASGFTCCGGTLHHAGQYEAMEEVRRHNIAYWEKLGKPKIAVFCASCHHGLADYAESTLKDDDAKAWKESLSPLSRLLTGAIAHSVGQAPATYGYHSPCHWGTVDPDMPFLKALIPGLQKGTGICCGMGGILKMSDPDLSGRMADSCMEGFSKDCKQILTGCSGCVLQLSATKVCNETVTVPVKAGCSGTYDMCLNKTGNPSVHHWLDVVCV